MDHLRVEIWDLIYKSGPKSQEQIAESLGIDLTTVGNVVEHEWFEIVDFKIRIASGKPPSPVQEVSG